MTAHAVALRSASSILHFANHRWHAARLLLLVGCLFGTLAARWVDAADGKPRSYALIVGVNKYTVEGQELPPLAYTESDAADLARVLQRSGYQVSLLTQNVPTGPTKKPVAPTASMIRAELSAMVNNLDLDEKDCIIVAFAGHGVQFESATDPDKPGFYFCPADADIRDVKKKEDVTPKCNLIPVDELYESLKASKAGVRLLLVDACRNDPTVPSFTRSSGSVTLPKLPPPPGGAAAFFSCSSTQKAYEDKTLRHGVFMHFVIQGLKGRADFINDDKITVTELKEYVAAKVSKHVTDKFGATQTPDFKGEIRGTGYISDVKKPELKPQYTNSAGVELLIITPGQFEMGTPQDSPQVRFMGARPMHRVDITEPLYIGKFEITQAQYLAVMRKRDPKFPNPSYFRADGQGKAVLAPNENTDRLPVDSISWLAAVQFCNELSLQEGFPPYYEVVQAQRKGEQPTITVIRGPGYRLPTEAEWEYCCRAGSNQDYAFGNTLTAEQAAITVDPRAKARPRAVGSFASNRFGLHDMHGNVWEWCQDVFDDKYYSKFAGVTAVDPEGPGKGVLRVLRGGSVLDRANNATSYARMFGAMSAGANRYGFRIARSADE